MKKAYKYRIYPTKNQDQLLDTQLVEAQRLYNAALQHRRDAYSKAGVSIAYLDQAAELKAIRDSGYCDLANFSACQDVLRRLDKAFKAFFRRIKSGDTPGFPRFKSRDRYDSVTYPKYGDGCRIRDNGKLYLQGIGELKVKWHRELKGKIKTVTFRRQAGKWYVCFSVEVEPKVLPKTEGEIGIDVGLETFSALSNGEMIGNPRWYRSAEAKLRRAQRKVARRKKRSKGRRKAVQLLRRVHEQVGNQRRNFHHQVARELVDKYQLIAVEDLNIKGLSRGMLSKSVNDAGWGGFLTILTNKAEEAGRQIVKVNPAGTSQTCLCGCEVSKTLAVRIHRCDHCGLVMPRDTVSAKLILGLGRSLAELT